MSNPIEVSDSAHCMKVGIGRNCAVWSSHDSKNQKQRFKSALQDVLSSWSENDPCVQFLIKWGRVLLEAKMKNKVFLFL